ncbi:hypothetical protein [Shinella sp.]|uniref:hypothetical protein n=1 Tax=Shinella sp. TaxID=1870904 RepID=UPI0028A9647B|nr:hypothetical protein [Shinella sp.]
MEIVGTLRNACRVPKGDDPRAPCLYGQVYGDTKGRFRDGEWITTSTIMEESGDVFRTRFSAYRVESWQVQPANDNTPKPHSHAAAINLFAADCHAASRKAGWYTNPTTGLALERNVPEMLCLIHSEVDEADEECEEVGEMLTILFSALRDVRSIQDDKRGALMDTHKSISKAMEGFRKGKMDDKLPHRRMIEVELADAMIRIGDLATYLGCDLGGAIVEKMAFNATREDHKLEARKAAGGKAF